MLDMSWGEVMLIGGVALIVIGPKDLPKALRTVGQVTSKLRRMAGEFQMQFNEAIREAELDEVRKGVDGIRDTMRGTTNFNPVQTIRDELRGAVEGKAKSEPAATSGSFGPPKPEDVAPPVLETSSIASEPQTPEVRAPEARASEARASKPRSLAEATARLKAERDGGAAPVPGSADDPYGTPITEAEPSRNGTAAQ